MSEAVDDTAGAGSAELAPGKARLEIRKGADSALDLAGLRFVACRREIEGIDGGVTLYLRATVEGEECDLLRFDFFRKKPHYHVPAENAWPKARADGNRFPGNFAQLSRSREGHSDIRVTYTVFRSFLPAFVTR